MASISLRQSIAWLPDAPSEPTSTVVLTSPQRRFVDVRVFLPAGGVPSMEDGSIQFPGTATSTGPGTVVVSDLEWGFAGTSSSTPIDHDDPCSPTQCEWRHWVDNRCASVDGVVDAGVCREQADGSILETGSMLNPATGRVGPYEEIWCDIAPLSTSTAATAVPPRCVVLQLQDEQDNRGVVQVQGQFCQGVARTCTDGVTVERWQWTPPAPDGRPAAWRQVVRVGDGQLPCNELIKAAARLAEGDTVTCHASVWRVVEAADL